MTTKTLPLTRVRSRARALLARTFIATTTVALSAAIGEDFAAPDPPAGSSKIQFSTYPGLLTPFSPTFVGGASAPDMNAVAFRSMHSFSGLDPLPSPQAPGAGGTDESNISAVAVRSPVSYLETTQVSLDMAYAAALAGNQEALAAFIATGPGSANYVQRSREMLLANAARGSVLALQTLAEWAASGYELDAPDHVAAIAFEYLAWTTHRWGRDNFAPIIDVAASPAECSAGIALAREFAAASTAQPAFDLSRKGWADCEQAGS